MLGFPEHGDVLTCPEKTLATSEFLSESVVIDQDGAGQTRGFWDGPGSFPHIPLEVLGISAQGFQQ